MRSIRSFSIVLALTSLATAGNVWQQVSTPSGAQQIRDFAITPSNNHWFLADRASGFWKSTDQGNTWMQINNSGVPSSGGWSITYDPFHTQLIAATCGVCIGTNAVVTFWRSSNEGVSWTAINLPPPYLTGMGNASANTGPLITPGGIIVDGGFWAPNNFACGSWYSTDGGSTTTAINYTLLPGGNTNGCGGAWGFMYNPLTKDYWMGTEIEGVLRSTDAIGWTQVMPYHCGNGASACFVDNGNIQGLSYDSAGNVLAGAQGGVFRSSGSSGNYTWTKIFSTAADVRALFRDVNGNLYLGMKGSSADTTSVYRSLDEGNSWQSWSSGIPLSSSSTGLEAWHFLYNSNDGKLYTNLQDGKTNGGYLYVTVNPVAPAGSQLQPPTNLQLAVQ